METTAGNLTRFPPAGCSFHLIQVSTAMLVASPEPGAPALGPMPLVYGSVCSGIEAATAAWEPLGWRAAFFAEIEPFPSAVLGRVVS